MIGKRNIIKVLFLMLMVAAFHSESRAQKKSGVPVSIQVDFNKEIADMEPVWAWFGYDEPNYTYMKDGKKLLSELSTMSPVPVNVRVHNMLNTGDGTAAFKWGSTNVYTEDANGNPVYDWTIVDKIFDTFIERGMKPMAQLGFMPEALSTKPQPYQHNWQPGQPYSDIHTGWRYPPKDYDKWGELVYQWVKHSVERYGKEEVESWYWELWNEPDAPYWGGTVEEYCKLYDYSADALKRALPTAKIGGPHVTGGMGRAAEFLKTFLEHCISGTNYATGKTGTPLDFVAFHAKGAPRLIDGGVQMNSGLQLRQIEGAFNIIASYPQTKNLPVIIGESDPEGCAACGMTTNPSNAYRNGTMYPSYTAATFARKYALADKTGVNFKGAVSWSFEFEDQPWFHGFRDLATNGVDKPVLNVFRMFGQMTGKRVQVSGSQMYSLDSMVTSSIRGKQTDIGAFATKDQQSAAIMVWNYHDDDKQGSHENIEVAINGVPKNQVTLTHYRIDDKHSNSYEVWKKMGSPQNPSNEQIAQLEKAGQLETLGAPERIKTAKGRANIKVQLPRQGVSLLKLDW